MHPNIHVLLLLQGARRPGFSLLTSEAISQGLAEIRKPKNRAHDQQRGLEVVEKRPQMSLALMTNSTWIRSQRGTPLAELKAPVKHLCLHREATQHCPLTPSTVPDAQHHALTSSMAHCHAWPQGALPGAGSSWAVMNLLVRSLVQESLSFIDRMPLQAPRHSCRLTGCAHTNSAQPVQRSSCCMQRVTKLFWPGCT